MADDEGWSNLHHAVAGRFTNLVQSLLEQEGDPIVNTPDAQGRTPLHLVCSYIIAQAVPLSLECESEDILSRAITETQQIIQLLLCNGADPQILDNKGKSPLHCLVDLWLKKQYPVKYFGKIINQFVHYTGNINVKDSNGRSLLHYVAGSPNIRVPIAGTRYVPLLEIIRLGAEAERMRGVHVPGIMGNDNDRLGAEAERMRGVEVPGIIENAAHLIGNGDARLGAEAERMRGVHVPGIIENAPHLIGNGNERLQPLAERIVGRNIGRRNILQELIQRRPNEDLVANFGNGNERLQPVAERMVGRNIGGRNFLQELIPRRPNEELVANEEEPYGITSEVSKTLTPEDVKFSNALLTQLLNCGAKINLDDNKGNTPLHLAIAANKFEIVRELLKNGSDVNIRNSVGQTALHLAVSGHDKFKNCAILLLHKGARANIEDVRGNTPIDIVDGRNDFPCFLRHVILLISSKLHPNMMISCTRHESARLKIKCEQECEKLNSHFELEGKSQLPILVQYHNFPVYTGNEFFQQKINCDSFLEQFPIYSLFLKYKFSQDKNRREMIEKCTNVFSWFGNRLHYTCAGRLAFSINRHWEYLPVELKIKILSYLSNNDLEYLEKQLSLN